MTKLFLASAAFLAASLSPAAAQIWTSKEVVDKFTDKVHVIATNDGATLLGSERFKVSFECRNKKDFVFTVDTYHELGGKDVEFKFQYRPDKKKKKKIEMRTFSNSSTGGMNTLDAIDVVNDILNADRLIVRAISEDRDEFDAEISLIGAKAPIIEAVTACGLTVKR